MKLLSISSLLIYLFTSQVLAGDGLEVYFPLGKKITFPGDCIYSPNNQIFICTSENGLGGQVRFLDIDMVEKEYNEVPASSKIHDGYFVVMNKFREDIGGKSHFAIDAMLSDYNIHTYTTCVEYKCLQAATSDKEFIRQLFLQISPSLISSYEN